MLKLYLFGNNLKNKGDIATCLLILYAYLKNIFKLKYSKERLYYTLLYSKCKACKYTIVAHSLFQHTAVFIMLY